MGDIGKYLVVRCATLVLFCLALNPLTTRYNYNIIEF